MRLPNSLQNLITVFEQLPGIGPKTAARLTFYLWQTPNHYVEKFAQALLDLKQKTKQCSVCFNLDEQNPCSICADKNRDHSLICVIEQPLDIIAFEKMGGYLGTYHVLGGVINPLEHIGPDELHIQALLDRIRAGGIKEVILATNPTMEGEATASYIAKKISQLKPCPLVPQAASPCLAGGRARSGRRAETRNLKPISVSRLGRGLPTGADIDYADVWTLKQAWKNRTTLPEDKS